MRACVMHLAYWRSGMRVCVYVYFIWRIQGLVVVVNVLLCVCLGVGVRVCVRVCVTYCAYWRSGNGC